MSRRRFLALLGGAGAAAALGGGYAWGIEPHWIRVVRRDLPVAHLPESLVGRTLAVIADLHVGPIVDGGYIRGGMDRVNALKPDMIAILGDFMSCRRDEQIGSVIEVVGRLNAPRMGIFAVLGNHDYGRGWSSPRTADALTGRLGGELGIRVLRNELAWTQGLQVVGLDDLWASDTHRGRGNGPAGAGRFFDPEAVLPTVDPGSPAIVLMHNPDGADSGNWAGYRGWILCGHTHGGQVDLPLFGPPILPVANKRYVAGDVDLGNGRRLYINSGLGYLRRVRWFCRPEITLFGLRRAPDDPGSAN